MPRFHLSLIDDPAQLAEYRKHCEERIEHFTSTGSKSGIRYWKQCLASVDRKLNPPAAAPLNWNNLSTLKTTQ